jgi:hypothetical protein
MYKVNYDPARNRFELVIEGRLTPEQVKDVSAKILATLEDVRPGFVAAIDIHTMAVGLPGDLEAIAAVQSRLAAAQAAKIGTYVSAGLVAGQVSRVGHGTGIDSVVRRFTDGAEWREYVG